MKISRKMRKMLLMVAAMALVLGLAIGGTVAWLVDTTPEVENTFTPSDVDITLSETTGTEYKMVPGDTIEKDPKVTVVAGSEDCWLFVKVDESTVLDDYISYEMAAGWTLVPNQTNVYYYNGDVTQGTAISVLAGDEVTVNNDVTKADMAALKVAGATQPTLTFTAYAVQKTGFADAAAAWDEAIKLG